MEIATIISARQRLAEMAYDLKPTVHGYSNRTLYINLSDMTIKSKEVTQEMKDTFTGGRGFCLWLLWNAVSTNTKWDDPENELVISCGVIGGVTQYPGTGKSTVVSISPLTRSVIDSNGGGYFGPYLKFAGWDALEVQGKSEKDVIIFIDGDNGNITIETSPLEAMDTHIINKQLTDMYALRPSEKRSISVMSAGRAAEHVPICGLNISYFDPKRNEVRIKQAARGGCGRVLRDKRIKAIVVKYSGLSASSNGSAKPDLLYKAGMRINKEIKDFDSVQNDMGCTGTPYLVEIMNKFDLLPCQNFRFGSNAEASRVAGDVWNKCFDHSGPDGCWYGCSMSCAHGVKGYLVQTGPYRGQKVMVDGPEYETLGALATNLSIFDPEAILELNFYADTYGLDTISLGNSIAFAMECYELGIINKEITGGIDLSWGNWASVIEMVHQMARGEGFGVVVGQGVRNMKRLFALQFQADSGLLQDIGMEVKGLEISEYMAKESLAQQAGYSMANKGAQHDEAWLIFMDMVHKQIPSFEDKAEALHYFPIWRTWFSLHGLCKLPWNDIVPISNKTALEPAKFPEHVENYCWLYEGVTGKEVTIDDFLLQSEKVYNFQRIFNLRLGFGTRMWDYPPYRAVGPVTETEYESRVDRYDHELCEQVGVNPSGMTIRQKIDVLRKYRTERYDLLVDAVYRRRGWTSNGIPTLETVARLGIDFPEVIDLIKKFTV